MYLVQFLLPLHDNNQQKFPVAYLQEVRQTLVDRFGGVTAFLRSPAVGLWKEGDDNVSRDEVVMFEVVSADLDQAWWQEFRQKLERRFSQKELLIWAASVTKL